MKNTKITRRDEMIMQLITMTQGLAYNNKSGVCCFCGGSREYDKNHTELWKPKHSPTCLYSQAEQLVMEEVK